MSIELATTKQAALTGSHANYWLQVINLPGGISVVVEAEDIIEQFEMVFSTATIFKSMWRLCKLRQDLGKPGSTAPYEIGKCVYYSERDVAIARRRWNNQYFSRVWHKINPFSSVHTTPSLPRWIEIEEPKRLPPYRFEPADLFHALGATDEETLVLLGTFQLAYMRQQSKPLAHLEVEVASGMLDAAKDVQAFILATG